MYEYPVHNAALITDVRCSYFLGFFVNMHLHTHAHIHITVVIFALCSLGYTQTSSRIGCSPGCSCLPARSRGQYSPRVSPAHLHSLTKTSDTSCTLDLIRSLVEMCVCVAQGAGGEPMEVSEQVGMTPEIIQKVSPGHHHDRISNPESLCARLVALLTLSSLFQTSCKTRPLS